MTDRFVVSLSTVRTQTRAVLTELEVGSQVDAVALYRRVQGRGHRPVDPPPVDPPPVDPASTDR